MAEEQVRMPAITAETLRSVAAESDVIFIGTAMSLGKAPAAWSGFGSAFQTVNYKVEKLLKGQFAQPEISVYHIVVADSLTADHGDTPRLSPALFAAQAKLIVSAQKTQDGIWKSLSEDQGALPASPEFLEKMEAALRAK